MMKIKHLTKKISVYLILVLLTSCSEFLLIPITVDYPFDKDNPAASPSEYEINIDEGLGLLEGLVSKDASADVIENRLKTQYPGAAVSVKVSDSKLSLDDILEIVSGKTVTKTISYSATVTQEGIPDINVTDSENINISICSFADTEDPVFSESGIRMTIKNVVKFCKLSESEQAATLKKCEDPDRETCIHIEARHENTSISVMLGEVDDLKDYKQFLDKIYSATLNDITFTILEKPDVPLDNKSFVLEAELFAQPVKSFKADGTVCEDSKEEGCVLKGVDYEGEIEDYFDDDDLIREKYLVGVFGTNTFEDAENLELLYTYEGKDILQKSIKHLNFQIGAKSYYLFFPGAQRPKGKLTADIKARLLFNVEPMN